MLSTTSGPGPVVADTCGCKLKLYVGLHKDELASVESRGAISPSNVMDPRPNRSWVALQTTIEEAADRAIWGFDEIGRTGGKEKLLLITFEFTDLGFGHFTLAKQLVEQRNGNFRFFGDLPLLCVNIHGEILVVIDHDVATPP